MLEQKLLDELKSKMPKRHVKLINDAYNKRFNSEVGRQTIWRFFNGETYSNELHLAVIDVAEAQQLLVVKTKEVVQ